MGHSKARGGVKARDMPTAIKLKDGGIVGYKVPAHLLTPDLSHVRSLEDQGTRFQTILPQTKQFRGVHCVHRYASRKLGLAAQISSFRVNTLGDHDAGGIRIYPAVMVMNPD